MTNLIIKIELSDKAPTNTVERIIDRFHEMMEEDNVQLGVTFKVERGVE